MTELRKVLMSEELFVQLGATKVDWGEPDADGFYTPAVYLDHDKHDCCHFDCTDAKGVCLGCGEVLAQPRKYPLPTEPESG